MKTWTAFLRALVRHHLMHHAHETCIRASKCQQCRMWMHEAKRLYEPEYEMPFVTFKEAE